MYHRIIYCFLLVVMMPACSLKPKIEHVESADLRSPQSPDSLCVYASKLKGMAELLNKESVSSTVWRYHFRFYPGDKEFALTLKEQPMEVGQELKAVRRVRVSGPESCPFHEYQIGAQPDY